MRRSSLSEESLNETSIFISRISIIIILYLVLKSILPESSKLPLIISTLLFTTAISQTAMLQSMKKQFYKYAYEVNDIKEIKLDKDRFELVSSIHDINSYLDLAFKWNNRRRILFRQMTPLQQNIANSIDYSKKLNTVDKYFEKNNLILSNIVSNSLQKYDVKDYELKLVSEQAKKNRSTTNNYFRVVESLCHYARDWPVTESDEVIPLLKYINDQCKDLDNDKTVAVVPGSGLGKVAHYLASNFKFSSIHAVEFSWLMVLMNEFLYSKNNFNGKLNVYPYLHTYSNHLNIDDQIRPVEITHSLSKPDNLSIHHADFTKFNVKEHLKDTENPENVVFVTCFFLDTAENLIEYLQSINNIASNFKGKKKLINLGPLKYGTAAKVEVSDAELKQLFKFMGWRIIDEQDPMLLGYLTDKKGLWQGYYNVMLWSAVKE